MHLAHDYIRPYRGFWSDGGKCRIRVYLGEDDDVPVVICSELPDNENTSITGIAEYLAAEIMTSYLLDRLVWIEHYPPEATDGRAETFELAVFDHQVPEQVWLGDIRRKKLGEPRWKALDRPTVESLVGEKV